MATKRRPINYRRIARGVSFQLASNADRKLEAYATYFLGDAKSALSAAEISGMLSMSLQLQETTLVPRFGPIPEAAARLAAEGIRRSKKVDCFDFVPSNPCVLYACLSGLERGTFCEWGSGMGVGVGIAEMLGFDAMGIEISEPLSAASRELMQDFRLKSRIETGSYFDVPHVADIYFAYCWPGQMNRLEEHFLKSTRCDARLLLCYGADDIRYMIKLSQ